LPASTAVPGDAPFGKLQALPTDGKAVTTWSNQDKAFTDIAKGLSEQIRQWAGGVEAGG
jgi:hypothetical protein